MKGIWMPSLTYIFDKIFSFLRLVFQSLCIFWVTAGKTELAENISKDSPLKEAGCIWATEVTIMVFSLYWNNYVFIMTDCERRGSCPDQRGQCLTV